MYRHVACLSTNASYVYVLIGCEYEFGCNSIQYLDPSCGYLSMVNLPREVQLPLDSLSYADVVKFMRSGFAVRFPYKNVRASISAVCPTWRTMTR